MNAGAATDIGLARERNEDRYWLDPAHGVFLVVDGVGGHAAGEYAAEIAVREIREELAAQAAVLQPEESVRAAIVRANNRIYEVAQQNDSARGMACVLTLALIREGEIVIGHVGDSRLYLIWRGAMRKLTSDHSPVGVQEDAGELSEEEAMLHPRRNEVFRDVGSRLRDQSGDGFLEIRRCRFRPDAAILLCSDGVTDQLTAARMRELIGRYCGDAARVARELVEAANEAGGKDNATALFIAGPKFGIRKDTTRLRLSPTPLAAGRGLFTGRLAFLVYGLLLGMLIWAAFHADNWKL